MNNLKEKMKQEAIGRMVSLNLHPKAINEFKDEGKLNMSLEGFLYWLNEEQTQRVKKFEEETKCLVYHVIQNHMTIGQMLTFLYVSNVEEEWEMERNALEVWTSYCLCGKCRSRYLLRIWNREDSKAFGWPA